MINVFVYENGNFIMSYETVAIPRKGECLIYNNMNYKVLASNHVIVRDLENGNNLSNIDIEVMALN